MLYGKQIQSKITNTARGHLKYAFDNLRTKYKNEDVKDIHIYYTDRGKQKYGSNIKKS